MIVVKKPNGDTVTLGTDQEKLLKAVIQFAIDESKLPRNQSMKFAGTDTRIERLMETIFE